MRAGRLLAGVLGVAVLAVAACELAGWPFLAGPMERGLARVLDRPVRLDGPLAEPVGPAAARPASAVAASASAADAVAARRAGGVRVRLLGRVELRAHRIEIGPPAWSLGAPTLVAEEGRLQLRWRDLWRTWRGEPLRIRRLEAQRLALDLERRQDGRASWQFGPPRAEPGPAPALPVFEQLQVRDGQVDYRDAPLASAVRVRFSLTDGVGSAATAGGGASAAPAATTPARTPAASAAAAGREADRADDLGRPGLRAEAEGRYRGLPLAATLRSSGVLPWVADDADSRPLPLAVQGRIGRAAFGFDGAVRDLRQLAGLGGRFRLEGPSLAAVGDVIGVTLPTTPAFSLRGVLAKDGQRWSTRVDDARIGRSRLTAALRYDAGAAPRPRLDGRVGGERLLLADLGPAIGAAPRDAQGRRSGAPEVAAPGRVLPDRDFDLPSLRVMDADVRFDLGELDLGTERLEPLQPMRARLRLDDGVLSLQDIDARTADGSLRGRIDLDGRAALAQVRTDLRWNDVRLERWLAQERGRGAPPFVTGRFDGLARLQGRGRSTAQILASLDGDLRGRLRDGSVSHLLVEAAGIDLAQALGVWVRGDDALPLSCALADLRVQDGIASPRVMVVDTRDSVVWVEGRVSLVDESMDLRARVSPRDFSPLALRTPVRVQGTLARPAVSLQPGPLIGKLGAAGLLAALVNPLAALVPLLDFGGSEPPDAARGCRALADMARSRTAP
ncbi:AsmA family protein [Piscinibacter sakaiensis]|uniref:AsmA family protein n=1 Tax=Piscinibacter sakaiensis TaxID=1547922 RepID=UPI0012FC3F18|nr:AsmA family protein [Piscinibacter sakaiensis]